MPRKPAAPKVKPLLSRPEVVGLCKRFLKEGAYKMIDSMTLYGLLKQYPSRDFWLAYTLSFKLNSLFWFKGQDGQAQLARDWATFNLKMTPPPEYKLEDTKVGEDVAVVRKPRTIAELLG